MARDPRNNATGLAYFVTTLRDTIPPFHPEARPLVLGGLALAAVGGWCKPIRTLGLAAAGFSAFFFRNPPRVAPENPQVAVSPSDGQVCVVDEAVPPAELELGARPLPHVATFLSLLDVHLQRAPIAGSVVTAVHTPGEFYAANLPEAAANERNSVVFESAAHRVGVVQLAGLLARRIRCDVAPGDQVSQGQIWGLIRFGSRVDTYLPADTQVAVRVGQRMVGGETVLGQLA